MALLMLLALPFIISLFVNRLGQGLGLDQTDIPANTAEVAR
jgi:hypothetical protein